MVLAGPCLWAWVRSGQGHCGFPRGGAYSGIPNRFNRFSALSELVEDEEESCDSEVGDEPDSGLSWDETHFFLESLVQCSDFEDEGEVSQHNGDDIHQSQGGDLSERGDSAVLSEDSELLGLEELTMLLDDEIWALGRGCSYYQPELFLELFHEIDQWGDFFEPPLEEKEMHGLPCKSLTFEDGLSHLSCAGDDDFPLEEQDIEGIILDFLLPGFPRGGALGSATTARKRQVGQLAEMLKSWGDNLACTQDNTDDGLIAKTLEEMQSKLAAWEEAMPPKQVILDNLNKMVADLQGRRHQTKGKGKEVSQDSGASGSRSELHQQSFYEKMQQRQADSKVSGKGNKPPKAKNKGKGRGDDMPRFDIRRTFPGRDFCTWQTAQLALESGDLPRGRIIQCKDASQVLLFQDMSKVAGLSSDILLLTGYSPSDPVIPEGKRVLIPYLGNIALREAWIAMLDGSLPADVGTTPTKMEVAAKSKKEVTTLRINAALDFIEQPAKNELIQRPALALSLAGVSSFLSEVKTFKWSTSIHRMVTGYISIESSMVEKVMSCSGKAGIFFQRLASQGNPPEVEWLAWPDKEPQQQYLERALGVAAEAKSFLAFRKGGGACIGVVRDKLLHKHRHWCLFGISGNQGPASVTALLESLDWEVLHRPSEPKGRQKPWIFFGRPNKETEASDFSFDVPDGDGGRRFLRIAIHHKKKKEESSEEISVRQSWWHATSDTIRFTPEIADTVMEVSSQEVSPTLKDCSQKASQNSPPKKKLRVQDGIDISLGGPGNWPLKDLGGSGDCGWRCLAYSLSCCNSKSWKESPLEEERLIKKIKEVGGLLRTQVIHDLLANSEWEEAWALDPKATRNTEDGPVAQTLSDFKTSLRRENRWMCGLTIHQCSKLKRLNVVIFELVKGQWKRTGLVLARDSNPEKLKTAVMILSNGHYYALRTHQVPESWLDQDGVVWCSRGTRVPSFFSRGGVSSCDWELQTPLRAASSAGEEAHWLRSCSAQGSSRSTGDSEGSCGVLQLRTASSRKSLSSFVGKTPEVGKDIMNAGCSVSSLGKAKAVGKDTKKDIKKAARGKSLSASLGKTSDLSKVIKKPEVLKVKTWKCRICGVQIDGGLGRSIRGKIAYHLKKIHGRVFQEVKEECKAQGGIIEGLSWRRLTLPIPFGHFQDARFRCPWCDQGLPGDCKGTLLKRSKEEHLHTCRARPKVLPTLWQFHLMGLKADREKRGVVPRIRSYGGSAIFKMGHKPIMVRFGKISIKNKRSGWVCTICGASSIGTHKHLERNCVGKLKFASLRFWKCVRESGNWQKTLDSIDNEELKDRAQYLIEKDETDLGHDLIRVTMNEERSKIIRTASWCRSCNASSFNGCYWFKRECQKKLICKATSFWKILVKNGAHMDVLTKAQMSKDDLAQLKDWVIDGTRGHDFVKVKICDDHLKYHLVHASVCKRCNACNYGSINQFRKTCSGDICTQSFRFWQIVEGEGILQQTLERMPKKIQVLVNDMLGKNRKE